MNERQKEFYYNNPTPDELEIVVETEKIVKAGKLSPDQIKTLLEKDDIMRPHMVERYSKHLSEKE